MREPLRGLSHVRVERTGTGRFLTDTILEAHRLNSPYLLAASDTSFLTQLKADLGGLEVGPIDRRLLAAVLLRYDIGSLLHGVFLAKKELAGGRLRVARALSAFIEADGVRVAPSGGVKNDRINPSGDAKRGFGHVPFARDEFTAEAMTLYVNLDLSQLRGYGLEPSVVRLLILLALFKLRTLLDGSLRLRTACDLAVATDAVHAQGPHGFALPDASVLSEGLCEAIASCRTRMTVTTTQFDSDVKAATERKASKDAEARKRKS